MARQSLDLPLHGGKCPAWLFAKMRNLAKLISEAIILGCSYPISVIKH